MKNKPTIIGFALSIAILLFGVWAGSVTWGFVAFWVFLGIPGTLLYLSITGQID